MDIAAVKNYLTGLQQTIVDQMTTLDGGNFLRDEWQRPQGGGGVTRLIEGGALFERGGVGYSHVFGDNLPPSASAARPELAGRSFQAMGVSLVLHPRNPHVPTVHLNVRCFVAEKAGAAPVWWFGGGMDLTPYYGFEEDAAHFHRVNRDALAAFGADKYPRFKKWCDEYFFLKHRDEPRGIGGVFFDDFSELGFEQGLAMTSAPTNNNPQPLGQGLLLMSRLLGRCAPCGALLRSCSRGQTGWKSPSVRSSRVR